MGYAKVLSGGPTGRYTIELDWGKETRDAVLAALSVALGNLDTMLVEAQNAYEAARARETAIVGQIEALIASMIAQEGTLPPGTQPDDKPLKFLRDQLIKLRSANEPLRIQVERVKYARAETLRNIAYWNAFNPIETRQVWCTDYTEDREPGSFVATMEIPGEDALILLAPGARGWLADDGVLKARELMSPAQAYFNAAILPGWQKEKPTYRWGVITALNYGANTANVSLAEARSSAQGLLVNQSNRLENVPVKYMTCDVNAFRIGDRVVVKFLNQLWGSPQVCGFLDNPRPCNWTCTGIRPGMGPTFASRITSIMSSISGTGVDVRARVNGGSWKTLDYYAPLSGVLGNLFRYVEYNEFGEVIDANYISVYIQPTDYYTGVPFPSITTFVAPPTAAFGNPDLTLRDKCEVAIYVGGAVVFNVAFTDIGYAGSPQRSDGVYVHTPGGISLAPPASTNTIAVKKLTGYTLISEA